ncbi:MAG: hypothetical protein L2C94_001995 [Aigarchaeota archaeon]|nr:hypothetical protein [Candidatus Wolframiiraptor gerlachensis]
MVSEELERKETTIRKEGLTIRLRRTEKGSYTWVIEADSPKLDPEALEKVLEYADRALRRKFLGEDVELPQPPKIPEGIKTSEKIKAERMEKTIPILSKNGKLFGRIAVYNQEIALEPLKPLRIDDPAIGWLRGFLEGRYGREKVSFEYDKTDRYFRRIILSEKLDDEQLEELRDKAAWSFIRATVRPAKHRPPRRWKRGR